MDDSLCMLAIRIERTLATRQVRQRVPQRHASASLGRRLAPDLASAVVATARACPVQTAWKQCYSYYSAPPLALDLAEGCSSVAAVDSMNLARSARIRSRKHGMVSVGITISSMQYLTGGWPFAPRKIGLGPFPVPVARHWRNHRNMVARLTPKAAAAVPKLSM